MTHIKTITHNQSPNYGERKCPKINTIILHYTQTENLKETFDILLNPNKKLSAHYVIDVNGHIYQLVDEEKRAWHAGVSSWKGQTDLNSLSIGIEIQNPGEKKISEKKSIWPSFPDTQMHSVIKLCQHIIQKYTIKPERILAHSDIAPMRKKDPGNNFNWQKLHHHNVGKWEQSMPPQPITEKTPKYGHQSETIRDMQKKLQNYGYLINTDGHYNHTTEKVVIAFQRHFRQARVDGIADKSTINLIQKLIQ